MNRALPRQALFTAGRAFLLLSVILMMPLSCSDPPVEEVPQTPQLQPELIQVTHPSDILILEDSIVPALLYSHIQGLDSLPLQEKKLRFLSALLPAVLVAKDQLYHKRQRLEGLLTQTNWDDQDSIFYNELTDLYRSTDTTFILSAMHTHPNSIVLAQAAIESGWGNSRIFGEANNLFGIWSYDPNEPRIAASIKRGDQTIYLRKYRDVSESISDYFVTIGRSNAYRRFREVRLGTNNVNQLIPHLKYYSERRDEYVAQLGAMIHFNNLKRYDHYQLDSSYYVIPNVPKE